MTIVSLGSMSVLSYKFSHTVDTDNVFAVLHYEGADDGDPKSNKASLKKGNVLEEHLLVPLRNPEAPGGSNPADRVIDLHFTRTTDDATGHLEVYYYFCAREIAH